MSAASRVTSASKLSAIGPSLTASFAFQCSSSTVSVSVAPGMHGITRGTSISSAQAASGVASTSNEFSIFTCLEHTAWRCRRAFTPYDEYMRFASVDELEGALRDADYLPDRGLATSIFLALEMRRPLLLEGEAGVGKTEVAKTLSRLLGADLIRLQCYEGIDASQALYEWDYARQLLYARALQAGEIDVRAHASELYGPDFLVERPLLKAIRAGAGAVLLIDELDRADDEFEAFLLEILSDYTVTVPEIGTIAAAEPPAGRRHVEPDTRAPRRAEAALPLPLDRVPRPRARGGDHPAPRARGAAAAGPLRRRGGVAAARPRPREAAGRGRGDRLGARARAARRGRGVGAGGAADAGLGGEEPRRPAHGRGGGRRSARWLTRPKTLVEFARALRGEGLPAGTGATAEFCRAASLLEPTDLYWAGRATLVARREEIPTYDRVFRNFFGAQLTTIPMPPPKPRVRVVTAGLDSGPEGEAGDTSNPAVALASRVEILRRKSFDSCTREELDEIAKLAAGFARALPRRRSRRRRAAGSGPLDLQRTLRRSLRTGGEPFDRRFRERRPAPRPLVLLLDVSGSMAEHSQALLVLAHSLRRLQPRTEVYCFGTRLTSATRALAVSGPGRSAPPRSRSRSSTGKAARASASR